MFISFGFVGNRRIDHLIQYTGYRILLLHQCSAPRVWYRSTGRYRLGLVSPIQIFSPFWLSIGRLIINIDERRWTSTIGIIMAGFLCRFMVAIVHNLPLFGQKSSDNHVYLDRSDCLFRSLNIWFDVVYRKVIVCMGLNATVPVLSTETISGWKCVINLSRH